MRNKWLLPLALIVLSACGESADDPMASTIALTTATGAVSPTDQAREVACPGVHFAAPFLDGPQYAREAFSTTAVGTVLDEFFATGTENFMFVEADGFSVVSDSLVLGYVDGVPNSSYELKGDDVVRWGECSPRWVRGDLTAYRWEIGDVDSRESTVIPISVLGDGCVGATGVHITTEVVEVEVNETAETVEIIAWARDDLSYLGPSDNCAGVGVSVDATAFLANLLGERAILDGGGIPKVVIVP